MTGLHYIADEELGGVEREYVKKDGTTHVGDFLHVTEYGDNPKDVLVKVSHVDGWGGYIAYADPFVQGVGDRYDITPYEDEWTPLRATDIIKVDGKRYKLADRKAEAGDMIHVTRFDNVSVNDVVAVTASDGVRVDIKPVINGCGLFAYNLGDECTVYEPAEAPKSVGSLHVDVKFDAEDVEKLIDMIEELTAGVAHLNRKVAFLEMQAENNGKDIEAWAETFTEFAAEHTERIESVSDDIVLLDERTDHLRRRRR